MAAFADIAVQIIIAFSLILLVPGIIAGIILAIVMVGEKDPHKRRSLKRWMMICLLGPVAVLFAALILWGLAHVLYNIAVG